MTTFDYSLKRSCLVAAMALAFVFGSAPAQAEGLKSHGLFSLEMELLGGYESIDLGDDQAGAIYQYTLEIINTAGSGFLHDAKAKCFAIGYFTNEPEHQTGFCTITDTDGDTILQRYHRSTVLGHVRFVSGTGKYDGLVGDAEYVVNAEDVWEGNQVASTLSMLGSYQIPKQIFASNAAN